MTVIRWNPLKEIDDLFARAGQFPPLAQNPGQTRNQTLREDRAAGFTPLADVFETPSNYLIELELPGVAASEVDVSVHEGVLTIAGERKAPETRHVVSEEAGSESELESAEKDEPVRQVNRNERRFGAFERRFRLPKDAQVDAIDASAREGVLSVSIARHKEPARRAIEVKVA